jgi:uncharacterized membrane protein (DUF4010 family)
VALGIGLLIGVERGWRTREAEPGRRTAGIRTFAISSVLGGVIGALAQHFAGAMGGALLGLGFAAYAAVFATFSRDENREAGSFSVTMAVVGMIAFALGAYALVGDLRIAAGVAVAVTGILALREDLHGLLERITWRELRSALVLLAMTFVVLPIVPDDPVGPFGGVNPRQVWLIAIVLAGVSFLGYVAVKYIGASHGVLLAAAAGGLVSSTAVTAANARRAAAGESAPRLLAAGVALATAISFARVVVIVMVINPSLLRLVAPPLIAAAIVATAYAFVSAYWRAPDGGEQQAFEFRNPFGFWSVVGFAVLLGTIIVIGRALGDTLGTTGAIMGAAALGLADVDAVSIAMARLAPQPLGAQGATYAILAAVVSNTLTKLVIGAAVGRGAFAAEIAAMSGAAMIGAAVALWFALMMFPAL